MLRMVLVLALSVAFLVSVWLRRRRAWKRHLGRVQDAEADRALRRSSGATATRVHFMSSEDFVRIGTYDLDRDTRPQSDPWVDIETDIPIARDDDGSRYALPAGAALRIVGVHAVRQTSVEYPTRFAVALPSDQSLWLLALWPESTSSPFRQTQPLAVLKAPPVARPWVPCFYVGETDPTETYFRAPTPTEGHRSPWPFVIVLVVLSTVAFLSPCWGVAVAVVAAAIGALIEVLAWKDEFWLEPRSRTSPGKR